LQNLTLRRSSQNPPTSGPQSGDQRTAQFSLSGEQ
jgi:hypothetical protein